MNCIFCGKRIPAERLKILPNTESCVECSQEKPYECYHVIDSKTEYAIEPVKAGHGIKKLTRRKFSAQVPISSYKFMNKINERKGI